MEHRGPFISLSGMDEEPPRKKLRKGTKSCIECRRRKIRCTWLTEHDSTCDGCLARGLSCKSQETGAESDTEQPTSRDRVGRLEAKLRDVEARLRLLERTGDHTERPSHIRRHDTERSHGAEDDLPGGQPDHIRSLFEGPFMETGGTSSGRASPSPSIPAHSPEYDWARKELMKLLPSAHNIKYILNLAADWWAVSSKGIASTTINGREDMRKLLKEIKKADCDPALLGLWLTTLGLTVQQLHPDVDKNIFDDWNQVVSLPQKIVEGVEVVLSTNHALAATVCGIECGLTLAKLQINCGRVRKGWFTIRMTVAYAELLGFPEILHWSRGLTDIDCSNGSPNESYDSKSAVLKTAIWLQLCILDRFLGALLSLSCITRARPLEYPAYLLRENTKQRQFFWRNTEVAMKVRDRDEMITYGQAGWLEETEQIECQLAELASMGEIPDWRGGANQELSQVLPLLHQHLFHYLSLRTYLPLMLRGETDARAQRAYAMTLYSCRQMTRCYVQQKASANPIFPVHLADFMAFTSNCLMLLDREGILGYGVFNDPNAQQTVHMLADISAALADSASQEGRVIAAQAYSSIESIRKILSNTDPGSPGTSLRIPLLGTMRVRRRSVAPSDSTYAALNGAGSAAKTLPSIHNSYLSSMSVMGLSPGSSSMNAPGRQTDYGWGQQSQQQSLLQQQQQQQNQQSQGMPNMDEAPWANWVADSMVDTGTTQDALWLWDDNSFRF